MAQHSPSPAPGKFLIALRSAAAIFFIAAGANHFIMPRFYRQIVPPSFPKPRELVIISGACEILGGAGLLIRPLRKFAGLGLIALLIAVFPANIYMAMHPHQPPQLKFPQWALWARLPLQGILVAWVWLAALYAPKTRH